MRAKYTSLENALQQNQFKRPLVLESLETPDHVKGDVYAVVDFPIETVSLNLSRPQPWCDVVSLHINVKFCRAIPAQPETTLRVHIGKKTPEELSATSRVDLKFKVSSAQPEYMDIMLNAAQGPMGTSDYRIQVEAVSIQRARTFLHMSYSYSIGFGGHLALEAYLGTIGRDKVGFTAIGKSNDGQPVFIGGARGLVERNTMRYYLAIDSFLSSVKDPPALQLEKRLQRWFSSVEQYPRQLHEINRVEYIQMKQAEYVRQQIQE